MGRLIDASLLDWWYKGRQIRKVIDEAPTVDPIHYAGGCYCRECEKHRKDYFDQHWCKHPLGATMIVAPDGWCAWGRRKETKRYRTPEEAIL